MNKHEKHALERYCENEGSDFNNYYLDEMGMRYKNGSLVIAIYPFCHELIKELKDNDPESLRIFEIALHKIVKKRDLVFRLSRSSNEVNTNIFAIADLLTASVPQILEAIYNALKRE